MKKIKICLFWGITLQTISIGILIMIAIVLSDSKIYFIDNLLSVLNSKIDLLANLIPISVQNLHLILLCVSATIALVTLFFSIRMFIKFSKFSFIKKIVVERLYETNDNVIRTRTCNIGIRTTTKGNKIIKIDIEEE